MEIVIHRGPGPTAALPGKYNEYRAHAGLEGASTFSFRWLIDVVTGGVKRRHRFAVRNSEALLDRGNVRRMMERQVPSENGDLTFAACLTRSWREPGLLSSFSSLPSFFLRST